ncbi:YfjI family protein [Vibrio alginolyticus]|uniref:YfjI family protein n=1 Tax=Vibrio alginolyticus TaxID=663 RepID=UPI003D7DE1B9
MITQNMSPLRATTGKSYGLISAKSEQTGRPRVYEGPIQKTVDEGVRGIQCPDLLMWQAVLSAYSFPLQGLVDVLAPNGKITPCSLFCWGVAESGERKSGIVNYGYGPISDYEKSREDVLKKNEERYLVELELWNATQKALRNKYARNQCDSIKADYIQHATSKPKKGSVGTKIVNDITPEALLSISHEQRLHSIASVSGEAGEIFSSPTTKTLTPYNNLWSGDPVRSDRKGDGSINVLPRLSVLWFSQPGVSKAFVDKGNSKARDNGFLARVLFAYPQTTQGLRDITAQSATPPESYKRSLQSLMQRNEEAANNPNFKKRTIGFCDNAKELWFDIASGIERELKPGGKYHGYSDHASKLADNICRVALVLHCSTHGIQGEVSTQTLESAISLCFRFSDEFIRTFGPSHHEQGTSNHLMEFISSRISLGFRYLKLNYIRQYGPNKLRDRARLHDAIAQHCQNGDISLISHGRTTVVDTTPRRLPDELKLVHDLSLQ